MRLMNADEAGTLRLLSSHRELTDRLIHQNGGRIANTAGDSILAEFSSAVDALECALAIQGRIAAVHDDLPEERRATFRIGLHVGEAMVKGGDLFGDGVNVAARMQALAEPGAVCLSATAHEFVHRVLPLSYEDLGPQSVKNLDTPIRAYLVRIPGHRPLNALPPVHQRNEVHLARRFHEACNRALMGVAGPEHLTTFHIAVLASLRDAPRTDQHRLAERVGIALPKLQRTVHQLEKRGLVERIRTENGRHSAVLSLTPAGLDLQQRLRPELIAAQDRLFAQLSDGERETLRDLLARVIRSSDAKAGDAES
jgi:DNA-binding MarR family transcriptional regulator